MQRESEAKPAAQHRADISRAVRPLFFYCLIVAASGCKRDEIHVYRVAKEPGARTASKAPGDFSPLPANQGETASASAGGESSGDIQWKAPSNWRARPAGGMRFASFWVPGKDGANADFSVVTFPGEAGGLVGNVNRWRGQVGLEPWDEPTISKNSRKIKSRAGELVVVEFSGVDVKGGGRKKIRMLGAILSASDRTWFFKLMGDEATVKSAKSAFIRFIKSLNYGSAKT